MHTARSPTVHDSVTTTWCQYQLEEGGTSPVWCLGRGRGSTLPCDLSHDGFDITYPHPSHVDRQKLVKQERIPVGWVLSACQPNVFRRQSLIVDRILDTRLGKHYLSQTSFAGGKHYLLATSFVAGVNVTPCTCKRVTGCMKKLSVSVVIITELS